jgi:hypothetical protein
VKVYRLVKGPRAWITFQEKRAAKKKDERRRRAGSGESSVIVSGLPASFTTKG